MRIEKGRFWVEMTHKNPYGIREYIDFRLFINNYIGFSFVVLGFGMRMRFLLRNALFQADKDKLGNA